MSERNTGKVNENRELERERRKYKSRGYICSVNISTLTAKSGNRIETTRGYEYLSRWEELQRI